MKTKHKILLSSLGITSIVAGVGVGVGANSTYTNSVVENTENNNSNGNNNSTGNNASNSDVNLTEHGAVVNGKSLTFSAVVSPNAARSTTKALVRSNGEPPVGTNQKQVDMGAKSITPTYTSGWVEKTLYDGTKASRYVSSEYHNNRVYMPILDNTRNFYSSEREVGEINLNEYRGWNMHPSPLGTGATSITYTVQEVLTKTFKLTDQTVSAISYDLSQMTIEQVNESLKSNNGTEFVIISGIEQSTELSKLELPQGLKKLTIKGSRNTINDLKLPSSLLEMEIYLGKALTAIDPLIFPESTNIISDTALASSITSVFREIKLSDKDIDNTSDKLQKAINSVYEYRLKERAFQGLVPGGYISSWDLTETKVTSFNHVTIPVLNDGTGRFFIAHVEVKTDGNFGPSKDETITNKPSNDSQIDGWFDWGGGWQKVQEVVVSSTEPVSIENATKEIMGFIAKYSNVVKIDVKNIQLEEGKTHKELKDSVIEAIKAKYGKDSPLVEKIQFILPEEAETI